MLRALNLVATLFSIY